MDEEAEARSIAYAEGLFARESEAQRWVVEELERRELPRIQVSPLEGRILALLALLAEADRMLELGTLGGYSALWLVSLLPEYARLVTVERDPRHAAVAREAFARAGEEDRIELREAEARETMEELAGGGSFDLVFIDADKESYPVYLELSTSLLRPGGVVAADNAFWKGKPADPAEDDPSTRGVREFNRKLARDPRFEGVVIPVRDGLAVARFRG